MKIDMEQGKMPVAKIIGTIAGCAIGGLIGFVLSKRMDKKLLLSVVKTKNFDKQKEKVMDIIETARDKFNEKVNYPVKENVKSMIHNQNHKVKASTKPINR